MTKTFYVTTPIYYPNDIPHLGHAYTTIAADVLSRWNSLLGYDVFFLTGTDEHGKKLQNAAEKAGKTPKQFIDEIVPEFKSAWKKLNIEYSRFIRTTDKDHESVVQKILQKCYDSGDIYKGFYEGLYCTSCEAYYTEKDCPEKLCPIHQKPLEFLKEESYFFKLSKYKKFLLDLYKKNPEFISPEFRKQEVINRIKEELKDFSISRTSFNWGIPLPFDKKHVCYVWFDALINYYSAIDNKQNKKFWPADVHIIGKDILWLHKVYWPAMLKSAKIAPPKKVFAHGWWTVLNQKMGKSAGNAIKIDQLIGYAGVDTARYFLLREAPFGQDGDFSETALKERHNNELANKLGNLVSRVSALAETYGLKKTDSSALETKHLTKKVAEYLENLEFDKALNEIFLFIDKCNEYIQTKKPWATHDTKILYELANAIKDFTILLSPFIPETAEKISKVFNFDISLKQLKTPLKISKIKKAPVLFNKIISSNEQIKPINKPQNLKIDNNLKPKENKIEGVMRMDEINFEQFARVDLRVATILSAEDIEGADKLYKLQIDLGSEKRTILAGIKQHYKKEHLKGKQIIVVSNPAPRTMKGIESKGMLLAASNEDHSKVILLSPDSKAENGMKVS